MNQPQDPTTQVLIQYANENLQLRLEVARLQGELAKHGQPDEAPSEE